MQELVISLIETSISIADNDKLVAPVTKEELHEALIHMHPNKSPGSDGFNLTFYQKFWNMCDEDIFVVVTHKMDKGFFLHILMIRTFVLYRSV